MLHLHTQGVLHTNLKTSNCLLQRLSSSSPYVMHRGFTVMVSGFGHSE